MSKIVFVRIQLGNDVMQTSDQVAEVLRGIARRLEMNEYLEEVDYAFEKGIQDNNGNFVGEWGVKEES